MPTPPEILDLVAYYKLHRAALRSVDYNEEQARRELLEPLFAALGWDMQNRQGYALQYRDVVQEESIRVGGQTKAPDYTFRIGGTRKFFVEAKKPAVGLHDDPAPAYQLRRYAWSAKLALSILTNFEEFAVYDCRIKPAASDAAATARVLWLTCDEYLTRWDELAGLFAREAILKGAFDRYAEDSRSKRGTAEVDAVFLQAMEEWRETLARALALRNPTLTPRALNAAVQLTLDRLIFLRIAEDRGLEPYGQLQALLNGGETYARLCELFRRADDRYNSGLFHFRAEKDRADAPDAWTLGLTLDDKTLKPLLRALYYPESPYEFSVIPADILGQVYERFLGKVIRLTAGHRAVVEEKPEVKKAGGVYYTPTYIVDYIVQQTIGPVGANGRSPLQRAPLRIVDPACGSGSFLLGAYQHLLDGYLAAYSADAPKWAKGKSPRLLPGPGGAWRLATAERKRILLDHLYGVDIDPQAVEVTKLSLLLKALEGETEETLNAQLRLFRERALPDLSHNIQCGNSLIGPEFYAGQLTFLDEEEQYRINAFDWQAAFPEVFAAGGFDVVIGNPPYIRIQTLKEWAPREVVFVEKALALLNAQGRVGFILPNKFLTTDYGAALRCHLAQSKAVDLIVDFGHEQVFENATTYTCLLFLSHAPSDQVQYIKTIPHKVLESTDQITTIPAESLGQDAWLLTDNASNALMEKLSAIGTPLLDLPALMSRGTSTGADKVFCLVANDGILATKAGVPVDIEPEILRHPLYATDFTRFHFRPQNHERIIFPYSVSESKYEIIPEATIKEKWPKAYRYLNAHKKELETRKQYQYWYGYSAPRNLNIHDRAHLLVPLLADRGLFAPLPEVSAEHFCLMASAGFSVSIKSPSLNSLYILGLLNSKLLFWNLRQLSNKFRGGWVTCTKQYFGTLPIRCIDFTNPAEVALHDRVVTLVEALLQAHRQLAAVQSPHERTLLQRQIALADAQLDALVYELYGLSAADIRLIEGAEE